MRIVLSHLVAIVSPRIWAILVFIGHCAVAMAQEFEESDPALRRYPSPQEWEQRIAAAKREDSAGYEMARRDFDLSVRSNILLREIMPGYLDAPQTLPHGSIQLEPVGAPVKANLQAILDEFSGRAGADRVNEWYAEHMDDLCLNPSPHTATVLADVALHGWADWSAWEANDNLVKYRATFPDIHRYAGWFAATELPARELTGLALRAQFVEKSDNPPCGSAQSSLVRKDADLVILNFCLSALDRSSSEVVRSRLCGIASIVSVDDQPGVMLNKWTPHLNHASAYVRSVAAKKVGDWARRIRIYSKGRDNCNEHQAKLQQVIDTDPDAQVRMSAKHALEFIRTAEWRDDP